MKYIFVTFAVLLFLLTLLSSFGGAIRTNEPFYDPVPPTPIAGSESTEVAPTPVVPEVISTPPMETPVMLPAPAVDLPPTVPSADPSVAAPPADLTVAAPAVVEGFMTEYDIPSVDMYADYVEKFEMEDVPEPYTDFEADQVGFNSAPVNFE